MTIDFGWFLPTMGDTEIIGPPTREATLDYLATCAQDGRGRRLRLRARAGRHDVRGRLARGARSSPRARRS